MAMVPDRLEDAVAKPEHHHVLDRFLTEVVIDTVDLALVEHRLDLFIQCAGGIEVTAERLFDNHAAPYSILFAGEASRPELLDDFAEKRRRGRQIEEVTSRC